MADRKLPDGVSIDQLLLGILTLLADEREQRVKHLPDALRTDLVLSNAGLSNDLVGLALNKNPDAVRMAVARAKRPAPTKKAATRKPPPKAE